MYQELFVWLYDLMIGLLQLSTNIWNGTVAQRSANVSPFVIFGDLSQRERRFILIMVVHTVVNPPSLWTSLRSSQMSRVW
jgi:hypothetical protein